MSIAEVLSGVRRWHVEQGEALALLAALPDACVDAVITDPPYSSGGAFRGDRVRPTTSKYVQSGVKQPRAEFAGDNMDQRVWMAWCREWLAEAVRVAKPSGVLACFIDWRQLPALTDCIQLAGWVWRGIAVWDKTEASRCIMGGFRYQAEFIVWASAGALPERENMTIPGVLRFPVVQDDKHHQAGKPTPLLQHVVRLCPPDGVILDPFGGSMTTLVAACIEGRRAIGIEREQPYVDIGVERLTNLDAGNAPRPGKVAQLSLIVAS